MKDIELPPLPERDTSKPAEEQGVFRKFDVRRTDGSSEPGGKHHGCEYFVLDVDHDPAAHAALAAYADAIEATHPVLAADMRSRYGLARAAVEADRAQRVPDGWALVKSPITEEMHIAAAKVLTRASGLDGTPQRVLDSLLASTPAQPAQQEPDWWRQAPIPIDEHPAVTRMRERFEAEHGEFSAVMQAVQHWTGTRESYRDPINRERENPTTEQHLTEAMSELRAAIRRHAELFSQHQEPPQPVERKPMTPEKCKTCDGAGGWEAAASSTSYFWQKCPDCERHHGIRE